MRQVHQFNNGIGIGLGDKYYSDSNANFELDYGSPAPELPQGINERLYEPGIRHALLRNNNVIDGGPDPWAEGDQLIDSVDTLLEAKSKRPPAPGGVIIT